MKRILLKYRLLIIAIIVFAIFASCSYYATNNSSSILRVKKFEEMQNQNINYSQIIKSNSTIVYSHELINDQEVEEKNALMLLFITSKKILILFFILTVILSIYQFCLYLKHWMIQVSQSKTKIFLMHYLQLKDGKKNALSICCSF